MNKTNSVNQQHIILNSINEGVFTVDTNWHITAFNRAAEHLTGIKQQDAIGCSCHEVFRANICEKACALRQTMKTGKPIVNAMAYIINKAGKRRPIRISTALLKNSKGIIIGGVETFQDLSQIEQLQKELGEHYTFEDIIGRSPVMMSLFQTLPQIAESGSTVLIEGASGTGKELFARAIHNLSDRKKHCFVAVNCAALPDTLLESELFGYKSGAFTGARKDKPGRFAIANGGTIFLDEIGDISPAMQVRLLRVLQERTIEPLGSVESIHVDIRVVAATNKSLDKLVKSGKFREDLFYRIKIIYMKLPGLRQRREDIPLLINHLVAKFNHIKNKNIAGISEEVMARLMEHNYPGNIRELENIIEHAFVLCREGLIELHHLPTELRPAGSDLVNAGSPHMTLKSMERILISEALNRYKGNRRLVAKSLGVDTSTLYRKIKSLGIETPPQDGRSLEKK